jgi:hypothetical protein
VFFLHLLVVASALFGFAGTYEFGHEGKDTIHSAHGSVHEVAEMNFKKPMVTFVLLNVPVPEELIGVFLFFQHDFTEFSFLGFGGTLGFRVGFGEFV